eukprot:COSAG01_NODE_1399_length_10465_cov_3.558267_4_plen_64_part_00
MVCAQELTDLAAPRRSWARVCQVSYESSCWLVFLPEEDARPPPHRQPVASEATCPGVSVLNIS